MTAVWYIGPSDVRLITAAQWTAAGITGSPPDSKWDKTNGWSIPATSFTAPELVILSLLSEFNTLGADGPRPGTVPTPSTPDQQVMTRGDFNSRFPSPLQKDDIPAWDGVGGFTRHASRVLAFSRNQGNVVQSAALDTSSQLFDISLEVPPCKRFITIDWTVSTQQLVGGIGAFFSLLYETTTGTPVQVGSGGHSPKAAVGTWSKYDAHRGQLDYGPSTIWRAFVLYVGLFRDAAGPTIQVRNSTVPADTTMKAVA